MDEVWGQLKADAAALSRHALFGLSNADVVSALAALGEVTAVLDGLRAALVHEADARAIPAEYGYPSATVWLRETQRMSVASAKAALELGAVLDGRPVLAAAVAAGAVSADQARVIGATVTALTGDGIDPDTVASAETLLVGHAAVLGPVALGHAGAPDPVPCRAGDRRRGPQTPTRQGGGPGPEPARADLQRRTGPATHPDQRVPDR